MSDFFFEDSNAANIAMSRYFHEDINLATPEHQQVAGIGPGAKEEGPYNTRIPKQGKSAEENHQAPPQLPFEIQTIISEISDLYVKMVDMKNNFEKAQNNPSINASQEVILKKSGLRLKKINKILISIPILLDELYM